MIIVGSGISILLIAFLANLSGNPISYTISKTALISGLSNSDYFFCASFFASAPANKETISLSLINYYSFDSTPAIFLTSGELISLTF